MSRRSILLTIFVLVMVITAMIRSDLCRELPEAEREVPAREEVEREVSPTVAIVLDDFGYTKKNLSELGKIGVPVTLAVLPNVPYSGKVCSFAKEHGIEVILHLPMEPEEQTEGMEKDTLCVGMEEGRVRSIIARALKSVPGAVGTNNHMGSRATKDERLMGIVLDELGRRDLFFLDSMTTGRSVCGKVAREKGVPAVERTLFIDNVPEEKAIAGQMEKLEKIARVRGSAVAIGHDRTVTIETLNKALPEMEKRGIRFVPLSEIVRMNDE